MSHHKKIAIVLFVAGAALRFTLCWVNPPHNAFDNHYEPIFHIIDNGSLPAYNDCWQCYHPPVYYVTAAAVGKVLLAIGASDDALAKAFQVLSCFYGILNVGVIYLILRLVPVSEFARLATFAIVCFLPRHIYMASMNSNDTISYLFVSLCAYLVILTYQRRFPWKLSVALSFLICITLFTKYTAYTVYPMILGLFAVLLFKNWKTEWRHLLRSLVLILAAPSLLLLAFWTTNYSRYNDPLPSNADQMDLGASQPRDGDQIRFFSFNPVESVTTPMLQPGQVGVFWNLIYSSMWYDNEPKFLYYLDDNHEWWFSYYAWLRGEQVYPGENPALSTWTRAEAVLIKTLGFIPLIVFLSGVFFSVHSLIHMRRADTTDEAGLSSLFLPLLVSNLLIIIMICFRDPVYSSVKSSYLLAALPAFAVFAAMGFTRVGEHVRLRLVVTVPLATLCLLSAVHILRIVYALT